MNKKAFFLLACLSAAAAMNAQIILNSKTCAGFWSREVGIFECAEESEIDANSPENMFVNSKRIYDYLKEAGGIRTLDYDGFTQRIGSNPEYSRRVYDYLKEADQIKELDYNGFIQKMIGNNDIQEYSLENRIDTSSTLVFDDKERTITINGITYYNPMSKEDLFETYGIMLSLGGPKSLRVTTKRYLTFYHMEKLFYMTRYDNGGLELIRVILRTGEFDGLISIVIQNCQYACTGYAAMHYDSVRRQFYGYTDDEGYYIRTDEAYPCYNVRGGHEYLIKKY